MIMVNFEDEKKNSKTLMNNFFCCMQRDIFKLSAYYTYLIVGVGSSQPYFVGNNGPFFVGKLGANQ